MATRALKPLLFIIVILILPVIVLAGQFKCTRVTDGDTITVVTDGQKITIRLVGIDAPEKSRKKHEPVQPFSQSSTKFLASLVLNKPVDIVSYGTDRYGRTLGVIYVDGKDVNIEMVRAGLVRFTGGDRPTGLTMDRTRRLRMRPEGPGWVCGHLEISM